MNLFLLQLFVERARERLIGKQVEHPTWYRPVLTLPFRGTRREGYLVLVLEPPGPFAFITRERPLEGADAPRRFDRLQGMTITGVALRGDDRVFVLQSNEFELHAHLYGAAALATLRRRGAVVESIGDRVRDREDETGRPAAFNSVTHAQLEGAFAGDVPIATAVPGLTDTLVARFRSGDGVDVDAMLAFRDESMAGNVSIALDCPRGPATATPIPGSGDDTYPDAMAAVNATGMDILHEAHADIIARLSRPIRQRVTANAKLRHKLSADFEHAQRHASLRAEAETLAAYQARVKPGMTEIELPDPYHDGHTVVIALDPAVPVKAQIDKRFQKAGKLEKSVEHVTRRLELIDAETHELEASLRQMTTADTFAQALLRIETITDRFGITDRRDRVAEKRRPQEKTWRAINLSDEWFVLVGRNNHENDELTFRHARPTDLWFHAEGVPGSHVILKGRASSDPPAHILELAASVAAHYSKARHSSLVPVIYTQRKYVRKFRGAEPGQVKCEREKMLMVPPELPTPS